MTAAPPSLSWVAGNGRRQYNWWKIVHQTAMWIDREGQCHAIESMDRRHAHFAAEWVKRHHGARLQRIGLSLVAVGLELVENERQLDVLEAAFEELAWEDSGEWIERLPLMRALRQRSGEPPDRQEGDDD